MPTVQVRSAPAAAEIPLATMVLPAGGPVATSWLLPPGANYPSATVVSGALADATVIPLSTMPGSGQALVSSQASSVVPQAQAIASSGVATPQPPGFPTVVRQSSVPMSSVSPDPVQKPLLSATPSVGRLVSCAQGVQPLLSATPSLPLLSATPSVQRLTSRSPSAQRLVSAAPSAQRFVSTSAVSVASPRQTQLVAAAGSLGAVALPNLVEAPRTAPPASLPPKLTENLPDPASVDRQKLQHAKGILEQLQSETAVLTQQNQVRKAMLAQFGAKQKAQHAAQVDSNLQRECMEVEQRGNQKLLQLQQATMGQTMALEQQAAGLTLRYQCQLVEEDRRQKDYQIQRQFHQSEMQILGQMQMLVAETSANQADSAQEPLRSANDAFRKTDSFDAYLGNPGGRPKPRGDVSI